MSFAFCGNRAGVGTREVLDYDPRLAGQCAGGISVYMSKDDVLVDVELGKYILGKHIEPVVTDTPAAATQVVTPTSVTASDADTDLEYLVAHEADMGSNSQQSEKKHPEDSPLSSSSASAYVHFCVDPTADSFHGRWLVEPLVPWPCVGSPLCPEMFRSVNHSVMTWTALPAGGGLRR